MRMEREGEEGKGTREGEGVMKEAVDPKVGGWPGDERIHRGNLKFER